MYCVSTQYMIVFCVCDNKQLNYRSVSIIIIITIIVTHSMNNFTIYSMTTKIRTLLYCITNCTKLIWIAYLLLLHCQCY